MWFSLWGFFQFAFAAFVLEIVYTNKNLKFSSASRQPVWEFSVDIQPWALCISQADTLPSFWIKA